MSSDLSSSAPDRPPPPPSPVLSAAQLELLARHGEERTAAVGDVLYRVGDRRYPFIAILEGEAAILDARGQRDRPARRLGIPRRDEPPVRPDRVPDGGRDRSRCATSPSTATRCGRCCSRTGRSVTSCSRRSWRAARRCSRSRASAWRSSARARRSRRGGSSSSCAATACRSPGAIRTHDAADAAIDGLGPESLPLVRLPGGLELRGPHVGRGLARARDRPGARTSRGG